jgi:hypothetical protein
MDIEHINRPLVKSVIGKCIGGGLYSNRTSWDHKGRLEQHDHFYLLRLLSEILLHPRSASRIHRRPQVSGLGGPRVDGQRKFSIFAVTRPFGADVFPCRTNEAQLGRPWLPRPLLPKSTPARTSATSSRRWDPRQREEKRRKVLGNAAAWVLSSGIESRPCHIY